VGIQLWVDSGRVFQAHYDDYDSSFWLDVMFKIFLLNTSHLLLLLLLLFYFTIIITIIIIIYFY